jgi:nicotinamide mononucleotide transporter
MKRNIIEGAIIGVVLTALSYAVAKGFGWVDSVNPLEAFAVFTSYASTYLCVVQRRANYVFGAISTAAYSVLFFQWGLIASAVLNAYLAPSLLYGWFRWRKDSETRPVGHVQLKWVPVYLAVTAAAYFGGIAIVGALGGQFATWDVVILVGSILAQFLLDNKRIETWIIWAVVNVAAIYVYFSSGLPLAGFQYIFFLANTVYGYVMWRNSMKAEVVPPAVQAVEPLESALASRIAEGKAEPISNEEREIVAGLKTGYEKRFGK